MTITTGALSRRCGYTTHVLIGLPSTSTFTNSDLRRDVARLLARQAHELKPGQLTYHLRRLRLRGLIRRIPHSNRYLVTPEGLRAALFYVSSFSRVIRPTATELSASEILRNRIAQTIEKSLNL